MRTLPFLALGATLVAGSALPAGATVQAGAHAFPMIRGSRDFGRVAPAMPMHVVLGLDVTNRATIDRIIARQATPGDFMYHRFLTPSQARALVAPSGARVAAAANFLVASGFRNVHVSPDNLLVSGDAPASSVSRAFKTEIHGFAIGSKRMFANTRDAVLPDALRSSVRSIAGLNSYGMHTMLQQKKSVQSCTSVPVLNVCALSEFGPKDFQQVYDTAGHTGANTTIAIIAEGDLTGVVSDLRAQETASGVPQVPVTVVPTGASSTDTSGADEWDMDTQYSTGIANSVKSLLIYDAPSLTDADTTTEFDRFVTDDVAQAASASFGECEVLAEVDGTPATDDAIFAEAALQGQTVFASAGDTGTFCPAPVVSQNGVPLGLPGQEYPASSTYVVSAGGTTLLAASTGAYSGEIGWYSGGGGPSVIETAGSWQSGVSQTSALRRSVPDVAMDADPNTGANVIVGGASEEVGGTSLSSPLSLGVWAILESAHSNRLGFAAPLLYKEFSDDGGTALGLPTGFTRPIGGFHDVEVGANPLPAAPGYDFSTGLGTFDVGVSINDITN